MFKIANYSQNAAVIVEGKSADYFFILRKGEVSVSPEIPIPGENLNYIIGPGDFFGVVSCMSGRPHIETAQTRITSSMVIVGKDQFGMLIQKNAPIAMKIIRHFSQRLRVIDKAITKLSFHSTVEEDPQLMFDVGEYYYEKQETRRAGYAYQKYLKYFPNGGYSNQCKQRLAAMSVSQEPPPVKRHNLAVSFKDGDVIFIEHEPGSELYIIQQGNVKITKIVDQKEVLLAVLRPGDIFGEMALLENKPRSATAIAHENIVSLAINKANFEIMVQAQPQLAVKLITILSERIWTAYRQLANLLINDPIGRIYDMLLTLVQKNKVSIQPKVNHTFDIAPKELCTMLGFEESAGENYTMAFLKDKNFRLDEGKIICMNLVDLEKQVQIFRKKTALERKREQG